MNKLQLAMPYYQTYFIVNGQYPSHRYLDTEMYVIKDNRLYKLVEDMKSEDLYIPLDDRSLLVYQAHLDGDTIDEQEARDKYPEEFV